MIVITSLTQHSRDARRQDLGSLSGQLDTGAVTQSIENTLRQWLSHIPAWATERMSITTMQLNSLGSYKASMLLQQCEPAVPSGHNFLTSFNLA